MSQLNKDIAKTFLAALGNGDVATLERLITDDCKAVCMGTSIVSRTRGHDEILGACKYFQKNMTDGIHFEILSMTAEEDRVSVEAQGSAELKATGARYDNQYHFLFFLRDGRVCRLNEYMDTKLADDVLTPIVSGSR